MSEYQYYEFLAVDQPLGAAARAELRAISTRARISSTSFVNSYEWGNLKADPLTLLERYFDLFLYVANWGTRRFAMRLPRKHLDPKSVARFKHGDLVSVRASGSHVILDIGRDEVDVEDWDDGSGWLASLAPLRAELLDGDFRLFHLLWLIEVGAGSMDGDAMEPVPNPGQLAAPLAALAEFLGADRDVLAAAYGTGSPARRHEPDLDQVRALITKMPDTDKVAYLLRLFEGDDPHLGMELRKRCRQGAAPASGKAAARLRTADELMRQADQISSERRRAEEERAAAERRRRAAEEAKARARHLDALAQRGESCWRDIEELITLRNASSYDRATTLLADLKEIAATARRSDEFARGVADIGERHAQKRQLMARLTKAGILGG
jgi:hypothetical protein